MGVVGNTGGGGGYHHPLVLVVDFLGTVIRGVKDPQAVERNPSQNRGQHLNFQRYFFRAWTKASWQ
jgi:hypothetical protein